MSELALDWDTPATWAEEVLRHPLALLVDHAHCELGAASTAQTMIARHPAEVRLVDPLAALASEELRHFRRVHRLLGELGGELQPIQANPYAVGLVRAVDRGATTALADRLLVSALIEARSHERFELLAAASEGEEALAPLHRLFVELGPSEAGHARLFVELAAELCPGLDVDARLAHWSRHEARVIQSLPFAPRIHSGPLRESAEDSGRPAPRPEATPA